MAERWRHQWKELYSEVITSGLCTGCAGCVIACPHDVIGYSHTPGHYKPFHIEEELGLENCIHGENGCTSCTRACPRFRLWEPQANEHLFGRDRQDDEMSGIFKDVLLVKASDDAVYASGQDGGLVSAILIWCIDNGIIDGALISNLGSDTESDDTESDDTESDDTEPDVTESDKTPGVGRWTATPGVAVNRDEIMASAGSRYTYSANTLAYDQAIEMGLKDLALVGMGCQSSIAPVMWNRRVGKVSKPIKLNIGLLCSKTFDDSMFQELFWTKYGLATEDIVKMNIKGVFQVWMANGDYHEINLKECHAWTREGCEYCPDFAAEHADISTGGIGNETDWTLTIVRTELGRAIIGAMISDGVIETRPGDDDPGAISLMHKLASKSRKRWPEWAASEVSVGLS